MEVLKETFQDLIVDVPEILIQFVEEMGKHTEIFVWHNVKTLRS